MRLDPSIVASLGLSPADGRPAHGGTELAFNCPFCTSRGESTPDTKRRLQIHIAVDNKYGLAWCFRCQFKAYLNTKNSSPSGRRCLLFTGGDDAPPVDPDVLQLPQGTSPLVSGMHAYEYVKKRGITDDDIDYYDLSYWRGRVIFPDYLNGELVYWVGRSTDGREPKYKNCKAARTDKIYNLGRFIEAGFKSLVIVEGPVSAISAGRDAVATYGKGFSDDQVEILKSLPLNRIFIALDPDAKKDALRLAEKLDERVPEIFLVPVPVGMDPNSLGRKPFRSLLRERSMRYQRSDVGTQLRFLLGEPERRIGRVSEVMDTQRTEQNDEREERRAAAG